MWRLARLVWILGSLGEKVSGQTCACHAYGECDFTDSCRPAANCRERNAALGKPAIMSSVFNNTHFNETSGPACLAVNGDTGTIFRPINQFPSNPACVHKADGDKHPFWEVDLHQELAIVKIAVIGRAVPCVEGYFGSNCRQKCGACLSTTPCDSVTGTCKDGCDLGFQGPMCDKKCPVDTYGRNCKLQCGNCKNAIPCDPVNGTCYSSCVDGYQEPLCQKEKEMLVAQVVGAVAGCLLLIVVGIIIVVW